MTEDGTNRDGTRVGAGRKPKSLHDKFTNGQKANVIDLPEPANLEDRVMSPIKKYLKVEQKSELEFDATDIFKETWQWLVERGCERLVSSQLIE